MFDKIAGTLTIFFLKNPSLYIKEQYTKRKFKLIYKKYFFFTKRAKMVFDLNNSEKNSVSLHLQLEKIKEYIPPVAGFKHVFNKKFCCSFQGNRENVLKSCDNKQYMNVKFFIWGPTTIWHNLESFKKNILNHSTLMHG